MHCVFPPCYRPASLLSSSSPVNASNCQTIPCVFPSALDLLFSLHLLPGQGPQAPKDEQQGEEAAAEVEGGT